eukprot:Em0014g782a
MNASNTSLDNLISMYKWVVDDVVKNVREEFLNEGVDAHILEELKHLWESKIVNTGALARPSKHAAADPPTPVHHREAGKQTHHASAQQPPQQQQRAASHHTTPQSTTQVEVAVLPQGSRIQTSSSSSSSSSSVATAASSTGQFALPGGSPQGVATQFIPPVVMGGNSPTVTGLAAAAAGAQSIPMMVQVQTPQGPVMVPIQQLVALQRQQQQQQQQMNQRQPPPPQQRLPAQVSLSKPNSKQQQLDQTDGLPPLVAMVASSDADLAGRRDQESDAAKHAVTQEASFPAPSAGVVHRNTTGPAPVLVQLDGTGGVSSSEEESEENDESSDEEVEEEAGAEDDPLNSDDDAGSENNEEEGEVESTIVCQWEKGVPCQGQVEVPTEGWHHACGRT